LIYLIYKFNCNQFFKKMILVCHVRGAVTCEGGARDASMGPCVVRDTCRTIIWGRVLSWTRKKQSWCNFFYIL